MRQVSIVEWGQPLEVREAPTPEPKGEEVLVQVEACGVCHSDVHIWDGYFDLGDGRAVRMADRGVGLPFTMGHEIVGSVKALGPGAKGVNIGGKYVVYPWIGCGSCAPCKRDEELLCMTPRTLGTRRDGGYGDHVLVPHARYLVAYDGVSRDVACTCTCSGITAYSALKKTRGLRNDDWLVIIGAGGVGGSAVHMAKAVVEGKILVVDIDGAKRAHARQTGAADTVDNGDVDAVQQVLRKTGGGAAAAIDFVGSPKTMQFGMDVLRKGGKLVMVGLYGGALPVSTVMFPFKMMSVEGSYVGTLQDLKELLDLVKAGKVPPIPVQARPAAEATAALLDLKQGGKVIGRVVLTHGS
jgi:D-arabinose 1-dehydrogenase-like Zn-dependent alcohol dehydrogenase